MKLRIATRTGLHLDADVSAVTLPTRRGAVQVLEHHASSVFLLKRGVVSYKGGDFRIAGGLARVHDNEVLVLAEGV